MYNNYFVYIVGSDSGTLYIGVTNDLGRRMAEHKSFLIPGFTQKYRCNRLLYYEWYGDIEEAIVREKQLKGLLRSKKEALIRKENPLWLDRSQRIS